ncbi:hypothetical protein KAOT1_19062 [Kordia algicida OT-1]|uniref:Uncharacterized protein n=1 Tax=Kordia algicida OT-1 TaxID=391587 RepID=A9DNW1_9FLAO|nr:hypothetical protein KAOT1_19062 [Kordia algicida OT-1]
MKNETKNKKHQLPTTVTVAQPNNFIKNN